MTHDPCVTSCAKQNIKLMLYWQHAKDRKAEITLFSGPDCKTGLESIMAIVNTETFTSHWVSSVGLPVSP